MPMLKQLRFDGYKLLHSRLIWIVYAVSLVMMLVIPVQEAALKGCVFETWQHMSPATFIQVSVVLFVAFFVGMDYRSGYIKTIISRAEWAKYVFSKVIYVFVFCILWMFVYHLLTLTIIPMGGGGLAYRYKADDKWIYEKYNVGLLYCKFLWQGLNVFAYGMLVMFVLMASKSTIAALVCGLVYFFLATSVLYPGINSLLINSFGVKEQLYIIQKYTVADCTWFLDAFLDSDIKLKTGNILLFHADILFYSFLSVGLSILICYKRKRKN